VSKLRTNFKRKRTIRGCIVDDLPDARRPISNGGANFRAVLGDAWTEMY